MATIISTTTPIAIVAGVGPGTGASVARRFAKSYPVILLARNPESYTSLAHEITSSGGQALGISTDVSSPESLRAAFAQIEAKFPNAPAAAAVFNASGRFARKPLLEQTVDEFTVGYDVGVKGGFVFAQLALPLLLKHAKDTSAGAHPPTLIFTGATASIKANALMSAFASAKFALRALSTSIAKEFASQGVHVAHAIIDGLIDTPRAKEMFPNMAAEAKIDPDAIAESYWNLHLQSKRCFTNEIDIRPMMEKW